MTNPAVLTSAPLQQGTVAWIGSHNLTFMSDQYIELSITSSTWRYTWQSPFIRLSQLCGQKAIHPPYGFHLSTIFPNHRLGKHTLFCGDGIGW